MSNKIVVEGRVFNLENERDISRLIEYYNIYVEKWWDPNKIHPKFSFAMTEHCCKYLEDFKVWWDPDWFNWKYISRDLAKNCCDFFEIWWDPERFNWESGTYSLIRYCYKHFEKWWDPEKIEINEEVIKLLNYYCEDYKDIWEPYVIGYYI